MVADILKRYLKGEYVFTVKGGFSDDFLKECAFEKASLRNVLVQGNRVIGRVSRRDRQAVVRAAERSGMEIERETEFGLFYTLERYKTRIGVPVGLVLAVLLLNLLSSMLWSVEVKGLHTVNEEDFMRFLADADVEEGTFLLRLDCNEIEEMIERFSPYIMRATVNLVGCRMYIDVQERELPQEIDGMDRYCNVVAAKDGVVLKADILAGEGNVKAGDVLQKGDLIAAGVVELKNGGVRYLEAKANVIAETESVFSAAVALPAPVRRPEKIRDRFAVCLFGVIFPRMDAGKANVGWLSLGETVLPAGILRQRKTELSQLTEELQYAQARLLALDRVSVAAVNGLGGKKVRSCSVVFIHEDLFRVDARFRCEEDVALQQYFEVLN